jgi:membrane associated rhomboid family serine protease
MIPIKTSLKPRQTPYANYLLIAANILVFILSYHWQGLFSGSRRMMDPLQPWVRQFLLTPEHLFLWQFITYAFLHGGIMHILGNMYFLYIFGNNVNDRLGNVGYLCFYLAGAVFSGIGHTLFSSTPVLGASGAVAAVTGAYLVLFPNTLITIFYMFFYIWDTMEIRALYFIAFKLIVWDNIFEPKFSPQAIAYGAHLAGYSFGILCILILLAFGLIDAGHDSLWAMLRQWNRRRVFRDTVSSGYNPFGVGKPQKPVSVEIKDDSVSQEFSEIAHLREQIADALAHKNTPQAAKLYKTLLEADPKQTMSRQNQLDLANALMSDSQWDWAARAYENYLTQYSQSEYVEQVQLMLGLLYTRYVPKLDRAEELLRRAREKLTQPGQIRMCEDLLLEISDLS